MVNKNESFQVETYLILVRDTRREVVYLDSYHLSQRIQHAYNKNNQADILVAGKQIINMKYSSTRVLYSRFEFLSC